MRSLYLTRVYVSAMLLIYPFFFGLHGYDSISMAKLWFFISITILWMCSLGLAEMCNGRLSLSTDYSLPIMLLLIFGGCAIISTVLSPHADLFSPETGMGEDLLLYLLYICVFVGVACTGDLWTGYLPVLGLSELISGNIVILQALGYDPFWLYPPGMYYNSPMEVATGANMLSIFANEGLLTAFNCLCIPFFVAYLVYGKLKKRFFLLIPVIFACLSQVIAWTASGALALGLWAVIFLPKYLSVKLKSLKIKQPLYISIAVLVVAAVLVYFVPPQDGFLSEVSAILHGNIEDSFGSSRVSIWKATWDVVTQYPIWGVGPDCLAEVIPLTFSRYVPEIGETITVGVANAHNALLQHLVSFGIVGTVPMALFFILVARRICKLRGCVKSQILAPALFCYGVQALVNIDLYYTSPLFWIMVALLFTCDSYEDNTVSMFPQNSFIRRMLGKKF